jgi:hypothetical protein
MQNQSPVFSRDPSSLLRYENSDCQSSSESWSTPKWYGCGGKKETKFIPYMSDSSAIGDINFSNNYNEPTFNPIWNNLATSNATISKYLQQTNVIPWDTDSSLEDNKNSSENEEKEVKLRTSDEYEIHTITEESEQVTQTDIKTMTPSNFSSKPITPNKRYSSQRGSNWTMVNSLSHNSCKMSFPNKITINRELNFLPTYCTIEKDIQMLDYVSDSSSKIVEEAPEYFNSNLKASSQTRKIKWKKKSNNQTLNLTIQKGGYFKAKAGTIKKGKLIKIKSNSTKDKKSKLAKSGSVIEFPNSNKYLQHLASSSILNSTDKPDCNFLQRMEIGKLIIFIYFRSEDKKLQRW